MIELKPTPTPKDGAKILVTGKQTWNHRQVEIRSFNKEGHSDHSVSIRWYTHWMPLPAAPQQPQEDENV